MRAFAGGKPQNLPVNLQGRLLGKSAEHTYERDLVREPQLIVVTPPPGDLASLGREKGGIANQAGAGNVRVGDRYGSVRNKRRIFWAERGGLGERAWEWSSTLSVGVGSLRWRQPV